MFDREWIMNEAKNMPAYLWWDQNGGCVPELQAVACIVLAQPASASICERINSEFEFVKDRRRNRLSHSRADKLVYLFHNLRMLRKMKRSQYSEPTIAWGDEEDEDDRNLKSRVTQFKPAEASSSRSLLNSVRPTPFTSPQTGKSRAD